MKTILPCLILLFIFNFATAQQWQSFQPNDTTYFKTDTTSVFNYPNRNNLLSCLYVSSVAAINADSIFYFNKQINYNYASNSCIDTSAPSLMGFLVIKTNTGIEKYINNLNDTIILKPSAKLLDTWVMTTDSNGLQFIATVTNISTAMIDSTLDSIKEITIQVYNGSTFINHYYSNKKIVLSKNHGFTNLLSFNVFPYQDNSSIGSAIYIDINSYRLNSKLKKINYANIDLLKKYQPGNEWILDSIYAKGDVAYNLEYYNKNVTRHDSIISSTLLNSNTIVVNYLNQIKIISNQNKYIDSNHSFYLLKFDTFYSQILTDTFHHSTDTILMNQKYYGFLPMPTNNPTIYNAQYNYCHQYSNYPTFQTNFNSYQFIQDTFCLKPFVSVSGNIFGYTNWVSQLGFIEDSIIIYDGMNLYKNLLNYYKVLYFKIGTDVYGKKFPLRTLAINDVGLSKNNISIYPNPSNQTIFLNNKNNIALKQLEIYNITGSKILIQTNNLHQINICNLQAGMYYLKIITANGTQEIKFLKE